MEFSYDISRVGKPRTLAVTARLGVIAIKKNGKKNPPTYERIKINVSLQFFFLYKNIKRKPTRFVMAARVYFDGKFSSVRFAGL